MRKKSCVPLDYSHIRIECYLLKIFIKYIDKINQSKLFVVLFNIHLVVRLNVWHNHFNVWHNHFEITPYNWQTSHVIIYAMHQVKDWTRSFSDYIQLKNALLKTHKKKMSTLAEICQGLPLNPLPEPRERDESVPHAPVRTPNLNAHETRVSLII